MSKCPCGFCHLHVHSEYSLLDGGNRLKDIAKRAAELEMPAIALTDHGVMYGAIDHYVACKEQGVKPILGVEAYVAPRRHTDKDPHQDSQKNTHHLTLWAKNQTGYRNLVKLTTRANLHGFYYKPRVDHELLAEHSEGIICGSACLGGEIPQLITQSKLDEAQRRAEKYREIFGKENFFLELMDHDLTGQDEVNQRIIDIHHKTGIPLVATNDAHYTRRQDEQMHKVLVCIGTNTTLDKAALHYGPNFYLKSADEMWEKFKHVPEALENTVRIADMIDLELDLKTTHFPQFDVPAGHDLVSYFKLLCEQRFDRRYPVGHKSREEARRRMAYEQQIIIQKGYPGYFLVVQDFINWSKERGILVGCRGSAAGCLVSYVLGITNLDPLPYGLLFERFLNPDRVSTPDIDVDFPDKRRDEVLGYVTDKYGKDKVAQIITFGTLAARAAVKDTARAMGLELKQADLVAKLIPAIPGHPITIMQAVEQVNDLKNLYESDSTVRKLLDTATQIEGFTRHASRHACGVVIGKDPLDELVPLEQKDGDVMTQYHAKAVEKIGLVKMDFLGLQNNTVINDTLELIKERHGEQIDLENIDLDDKKVFDMLGRGDGISVFQMEGTGMRNLLREMKPESLEHIIAQISLYRPGPMDEIPRYVAGRHGGVVKYPHPKLEPVLKDTYGMLLYQEQVMQASQLLAGFSGGQSETLMKAMSKKQAKAMAEMQPLFIDGCAKNGISKGDATEIFDRMEAFAKYAFNKSHAAYYGLVSYWTAYLKVNFAPEFMACKMTSLLDNKQKLLVVIDDCRKHGIQVLPPDINESGHAFTVTNEGIRFGLQAIKGIGEGPVNAIKEARENGGRFANLFDFCERVGARMCNKSCAETLIKSGAFDRLHANRKAMLEALDGAMSAGLQAQADALSGQTNMFGEATEVGKPKASGQLPDIADALPNEKLAWEKELVGLYVSDHPLNALRGYLEAKATPVEELGGMGDGAKVTLGGLVTQFKRMTNKEGRSWAAFTLEDLTGSLEVLAFAKTFEKCSDCLREDAKLLVSGRLTLDNRRGGNPRPDEDEAGDDAALFKLMADHIEVISDDEAAKLEGRAPIVKAKNISAPAPSAMPNGNVTQDALKNGGITLHRNGATLGERANGSSAQHGTNGQNGNGTATPQNSLPANHWSKSNGANGNGHSNGHANGNGRNGANGHANGNGGKPAPSQPSYDATIPRGFYPPEAASDAVHLHIAGECANSETLHRLFNVIRHHPGEVPVWLHIDDGVQTVQMRVSEGFFVAPSPEFCDALLELLEEGCVMTPSC